MQIVGLQRLMKTLHQQLRAVAVDGQARRAFLAAVEEAVAVGALGVQLREQVFASGEGGAQRLVKRRHARRLGERKAGSLSRKHQGMAAGRA